MCVCGGGGGGGMDNIETYSFFHKGCGSSKCKSVRDIPIGIMGNDSLSLLD